MFFLYIRNSINPHKHLKMNTDNTDNNNNNMTDDEFFALHPQPDLVVGLAYPTLIFPEDADEENTSIYAFPPKPEKYKRQYAVDLSGCPMNLVWEFDEDDLSDLPDLIPNEDLQTIRSPVVQDVVQERLNQKRAEESYWTSLTTIDEIDEAIQNSLSRQYNLARILKKERDEDKKEKQLQAKKDQEERMQIINDREMRRASILQDKEEQERVQAIKDRNERCFRTLEKRKDDALKRSF